ncbi:hypothetical protein Tco_0927797 [Tanacetum coccineum]
MVAYLKKPEGSEGFHQIVDFLNVSHKRYALTKNPTIYVSFIKQFWQTATTITLDNREIELTATIDGQVKTITEASVRRHLQLADVDGISSLPTTEIFKQLSLMGYGPVVQGEGSTQQIESHHTPTSAPSTSQPPMWMSYGGATTTVTGLEAGQGSGNIDKTPTMPHDSLLLRVNTLGSDEHNMTQQELMVLCTTLSKKVESLETDLKQTKQIYGAAYTKLIKKIVAIDQDPAILLVKHDAEIQGRHGHDMEFDVSTAEHVSTTSAAVTTANVAVSTANPTRNTEVSTNDDITLAETLIYIRKRAAKDKGKGKGKLAESEIVQTKTKLQQQERLGFKAVVRLQAELDEEERQRTSRVNKVASSFNLQEWEDIQARIEADKELVQRLQSEEREKYTEIEQARMLAELINQRKSYTHHQLRGYSFDEIKTLFKATMRRVNTFVLIESEVDRAVPELAGGCLKRVAEEELNQESSKRQKTGESSELAKEPRDKEANEQRFTLKAVGNTDDELWKLQKHIPDLTWKLYDSYRVHHVYIKEGIAIYMLVRKEYPLSRGTLTLMPVAKLIVEQDNEMSRELLRKIFMQAERPRR